MDNFLKYFYQDIGRVFRALLDIFSAFFSFMNYLFNFPMRMKLIQEYDQNFSMGEWIMLVITEIVLLMLAAALVFAIIRACRKLFRFRIPVKKYDEMVKQVHTLQRDLLRANYEKDRLLQMKVAELGVPQEQIEAGFGETDSSTEKKDQNQSTGNRNTVDSPCVDPADSRFFRLTVVDNFYKTEYKKPAYEDDITLPEFCERFQKYSASQLQLYYDLNMMRYFVASMGAARIIILQGISGTGKTSLPYAFGRFVQKDTTVVSVQPSWRERTELYGYYNEFTKRYTETDFLKAIYEGNYYRDPHIVILDEMNIARVEYYFAEVLSVLEMPSKEEWTLDLVPTAWEGDPKLLTDGKIRVSDSTWFVGTANNDDSTFTITDKVYDRAMPIELNDRADEFTCPANGPCYIRAERLMELFEKAKEEHPISDELMEKMEKLDQYLVTRFRLAFGNRIMKQLYDFIPVYVACGGTELGGMDYIVARKVLKKFESMNVAFVRDEMTGLIEYIEKTFGPAGMPDSIAYLERIKNMY